MSRSTSVGRGQAGSTRAPHEERVEQRRAPRRTGRSRGGRTGRGRGGERRASRGRIVGEGRRRPRSGRGTMEIRAPVAQWTERGRPKACVGGSSPSGGATVTATRSRRTAPLVRSATSRPPDDRPSRHRHDFRETRNACPAHASLRRRSARCLPATGSTSPLPVRRDHDLAWDADLVRVDQRSPFARSRVHVDPSVVGLGREEEGHLHGGAGWDHVRSRRPDEPHSPSSSSATNSVAGSELLLSTVTFQHRAFGGTGPAAGGSGVGTGVGLGKTGGGGLGKAGNGGSDTPAGTYSSAAPFETHTPSSLQSLPPATRTVPSSRSVNEEPSPHRSMLEAVVDDPVRGSYSAAAVQAEAGLGSSSACHQHGAIRQQCLGLLNPDPVG